MIDPAQVNGHRCLVIVTSTRDLGDQLATVGLGRWDGAALWLDRPGVSKPVQIVAPGGQAVIVEMTPAILKRLRKAPNTPPS